MSKAGRLRLDGRWEELVDTCCLRIKRRRLEAVVTCGLRLERCSRWVCERATEALLEALLAESSLHWLLETSWLLLLE